MTRDGDGTPRRYTVVSWRPFAHNDKPRRDIRDRVSGGSLVAAGLLITLGIIGGAYVVYDAQYQFALAHNWGNEEVAHIQAAIPEVVWIGMALLGLSQALRGKRSARAISGIILFFSLSIGAQLMYAMPNPGGYLVAIITPLALALLLETWLDGVHRWALAKDGISADEKPVLIRIIGALRQVPVLFYVPAAALAIGMMLDPASTWANVRSWLLFLVPWSPLVLGLYPLAWFLRLGLDREGTKTGMTQWLIDLIPYAPGRTKAQDDARQARQQADRAEEMSRLADERAAGEIAEANRRADEAIEQQRQEHAEQLESTRREAAEREAEQQKRHAEQVAALEQQLGELREQSSADVDQVRARARAEFEELRGELNAQVDAERERAEKLVRDLSRANEQLRELRAQVDTMRQSASGRERLILAYEDLGRQGDPRYGHREYISELLPDLMEAAGLQSSNTARNYLSQHLTELEARETNGVNGHHTLAGMS